MILRHDLNAETLYLTIRVLFIYTLVLLFCLFPFKGSKQHNMHYAKKKVAHETHKTKGLL